MNRRSLFLSGALLLPALPVLAQQQRPTGVLDFLSGTGVGANTFVERATISDNFEIQSSQILLEKSAHPQIREFAQDMVTSHTAMSAELRSLPEATTRQPATGDDRMQAKLASLRGYQGDELDRWYVQMQVESHREAATIFQSYAENGEVGALRAFAQKHLPMIRMHLQRAEALQAPRAG
jgi:putative membrane protein